jgi:hypothetical protein
MMGDQLGRYGMERVVEELEMMVDKYQGRGTFFCHNAQKTLDGPVSVEPSGARVRRVGRARSPQLDDQHPMASDSFLLSLRIAYSSVDAGDRGRASACGFAVWGRLTSPRSTHLFWIK